MWWPFVYLFSSVPYSFIKNSNYSKKLSLPCYIFLYCSELYNQMLFVNISFFYVYLVTFLLETWGIKSYIVYLQF